MNPFVRLNFLKFIPFHLNNFSAICVAIVSFHAAKFQHVFLHNFTKYDLEIVVLFSLVGRIFLLIHDSTYLLSTSFLELQSILKEFLAKPL